VADLPLRREECVLRDPLLPRGFLDLIRGPGSVGQGAAEEGFGGVEAGMAPPPTAIGGPVGGPVLQPLVLRDGAIALVQDGDLLPAGWTEGEVLLNLLS
jgi:hypothetical protein